MANTPRPLPKLAELFIEPDEAYKNDLFQQILNQPPPAKWVKKHPTVPGNWEYLPIDKVEHLLVYIFGGFEREILSVQIMANAVVSVVRVIVVHPVTGEKIHHDGVGAAPIQVNKDSNPLDFSQIKSGSIQMAAPSSASYALSNACEKFGKVFGRDLNRKDTIPFDPTFKGEAPVVTAPVEIPPATPITAPTPVATTNTITKPDEEGDVIEWN